MMSVFLPLISWYLLITLIGWLTFPIVYRVLRFLPGRGYAFSRILGLLLWSYVYWLLASLGILLNNIAGILFALALLIALSAWLIRYIDLDELKSWWREHRAMIITVELLFAASFILMVIIRASNPEIDGTEKPMELAFINALLSSKTFPPHDPWLSGYAISYYYFGYVMMAMLAKISGVPGEIAFNLGIALVFALAAVGAFGLVYELLRKRSAKESNFATLYALLAPLFLLIVSNLEGFLHSLHQRGVFWVKSENGELTSSFWKWLDIKNLNIPPSEPFSWFPSGHWWWWRASRVLQDYNFLENPLVIIDEFPFFSFLLADLHPHVLAIPFLFLVVALALCIFLSHPFQKGKWIKIELDFRTIAWLIMILFVVSLLIIWKGVQGLSLTLLVLGITGVLVSLGGAWQISPAFAQHRWRLFTVSDLGKVKFEAELAISRGFLLILGVVVGGMAFLNIWDVLVAVVLIAGIYAYGRIINNVPAPGLINFIKDFVVMSIVLGITSLLLYLPFYIGFASQAGGPLPNLIFPTTGTHFWVMFAPFLIPIIAFLIYLWRKFANVQDLKTGAGLAISFTLLLWFISFLLGFIIVNLPEIQGIEVGNFYLNFLGAPDSTSLFKEAIVRRFTRPGGWVTLLILFIGVLGLLSTARSRNNQTSEDAQNTSSSKFKGTDYFVLLLILMGILLTLGVEFVYLRDQFGWRMNTIFKFYYQTWLIWGIAATYAVAVLLSRLRAPWSGIFRALMLILLVMSLVYPVFSLWSKTNGFQPTEGWTLNGIAFLERRSPDEMEAIEWLKSAPDGIVAEAVSSTGGSYEWPSYARVSTLSGKPAVLGWVGHEVQWRGSSEEIGSRQSDLEILYCSRDFEQTESILDKYNIRYVFVGATERATYRPNEGLCPTGLYEPKMDRLLTLVFNNDQAQIYEVSGFEN